MINNVIECYNINKEFLSENGTSKLVVKDFNIDICENEMVVLFGPGQCGKTTIMKILAGLESPTDGKVIVNGKTVFAPGPERGVIYQNTLLFPWKTVMGNVSFGPRSKGLSIKEARKKAQYYIDLVGLKGFENSFPAQLSGGMQQRVGIARAYAIEPAVMLMDEPFGHLDAQTRYLMQEELIRIWEKEKRTVLFITNNIEEAVFLADRIVMLSRCPATVISQYKVELSRPRNYTDEGFLKIRKMISDEMEDTHCED